MKLKERFKVAMMSFFVCTACITVLEGVMGVMFFPDAQFGYEAFFSPPLFALISVALSVVNWSEEKMTVRGVIVCRAIHLLLIEAVVFGINAAAGNVISAAVAVTLALGIAAVFVLVYAVIELNDRRSAAQFNERLRAYQQAAQKESGD